MSILFESIRISEQIFVSYSIDLCLVCFYLLSEACMNPSLMALIADMNLEPKKKVKLREDWREKSRPIPPGGTYPAKDHCRFFLSFLFVCLPHYFCLILIKILGVLMGLQSVRAMRHLLHCPCEGGMCISWRWNVKD